jgi:hypothetical protein
MAKDKAPAVRVYVREIGGKRSFCPAPSNPVLTTCYWLRYEHSERPAEATVIGK